MRYFRGAILLILVGIVYSSNYLCAWNEGINDDFCDCPDGSDENSTSACSFVSKGVFFCRGSGALNQTIPFSRVNDGVCDCCDGSDESESPFNVQCSDSCSSKLLVLRQEALQKFRLFQAASRSKNELVDAFRRNKSAHKRTLDGLKDEKHELIQLLGRMKYLLSLEKVKEDKQRFSLIRERQGRCASGDDESCDFFRAGYFDEDELIHDGFPIQYANPRKRLKYVHTDNEVSYANSFSGIEKVRQGLCLSPHLLPDDDARIFSRVGELLSFASTSGYQVSRKKNKNQIRKETLLGPFLENGSKGRVVFGVFFSEVLAVLLSPLLLSLHGLAWMTRKIGSLLWQGLNDCAGDLGVVSTDSGVHLKRTHKDTEELSNEYIQPSFGQQICQNVRDELIAIYDENSHYNEIFNSLDITTFSAVYRIMDIFHPLFYYPAWIGTIMWTSPGMYLDYFSGKDSNLPERRQCCLLRRGIELCNEQIDEVERRINNEENFIRMSREIPLEDTRDQTGQLWKTTKYRRLNVDYGLDGSWEALKDVCIEKDIREYKYRFCFFKEIKQNHVLIGKYIDWAPIEIDGSSSSSSSSSSSTSSSTSSSSSSRNTGSSSWFEFSKKDDTKSLAIPRQNSPLSMEYLQYYDNGAHCNGHPRRSKIHLLCGATNDIIDVTEEETCVYEILVNTPLACSNDEEKIILQRLDDLQIFGFSKRTSRGSTMDDKEVGITGL